MDVGQIRRALADAAATVDPPDGTASLTAYGFSPGAPAVPAVFPTETTGNYVEGTNGTASLVVTLRVLTSRAEEEWGQQTLDAYLASEGVSSLPAAIAAEMPEASVVSFDGYRPYEHANGSFWGAELTVVVLA
jgi:hypothetical protein